LKLPFEFIVARRYIKGRRKTGFINLITYISISGVTIGVAALIIVLSVMNGFESEIRERIIGVDTHLQVRQFHHEPFDNVDEVMASMADIPHITAMTPYVHGKGMMRSLGNKEQAPVAIRGMDAEGILDVTEIVGDLVWGDLNLGNVPTAEGRDMPGVLVGRYLADRLYLDVGDKVLLMSLAGVTNTFTMPPMKTFIVTGVFETGFFEFDDTYIYISLKTAQELNKLGNKVEGVEVRLDDLDKAGEVKEMIKDRLSYKFNPQTWFELRQNLFSWMQLEKYAAFIILSLIIMVAAFNIISTLIMVVMEKTREIGIFKSMGATDGAITRIFLYEGIFVGVVGTLIGIFIGFGLCWAQQTYGFFSLPGDVYFIDTMPVKMKIFDFLAIATASVLICLVSSIYPAKRAAKLDPVEAIRHE